ncbi:unnamed protein product [Blepharisma stoltei]|uniref:Pre-mRNA polyadenylation factor Fip1 domain-containing protein n=1 Tax=Blepharisma stoltei TaxID=1481888 RepID=A0AAU9IWI3_9CILI|nr:unnamed protein product [Blepharisma stoltei]
MESEEEDLDVKIYWGDCNDYLLEDWVESRKKVHQYVGSDYKPTPMEKVDKPWLIPGAEISDFFNFGFTEESWYEFLLKIIKKRQEKIVEKEKELQEEHMRIRNRSDSPERYRYQNRDGYKQYRDYHNSRR